MSAATTMAINIIYARLAIALVLSSMHKAAILTAVSWDIITSTKDIIASAIIIFQIDAVIDLWCECAWAEATFNQGVTKVFSSFSQLTAALACAVIISLTSHSFASVCCAVGAAWLTGVMNFMKFSVHHLLSLSLANRLLRGESS